jgi:hypothetical protein
MFQAMMFHALDVVLLSGLRRRAGNVIVPKLFSLDRLRRRSRFFIFRVLIGTKV